MMIKGEVIIGYDEVEKLVKEHLEKIHGLKISSIHDRSSTNGAFNGYRAVIKSTDVPLAGGKSKKKNETDKVMI